ncbi:MAG: AAA family ATPase [Acidobacteriota bacterium]|nr:AAA family ATPase [Acidobacteriota bacterium]
MALKLPIGIDNFKKVIEDGFHYVDKSMFIAEVLETSAETLLITRPRRFGKTINMSMLHAFFDQSRPDNGKLFEGLAIQESPWWSQLGSRPIIFLSFKDLKARSYEAFLKLFATMTAETFRSRKYLLEKLDSFDSDDFLTLAKKQGSETDLMGSLALLVKFLARHHDNQVILLIDEYDSPIHSGYAHGYYPEIASFMRGLLGKALKGNVSLKKAVLTGILRVARESIFSDLNQVDVFTILSNGFSDKFGFTEAEMKHLLELSGLAEQTDAVRKWYNGYLAGETTIYNPWSILKYIDKYEEGFKPHWVNTSSNDLIQEQLLHASPEVLDDFQRLLRGETVETTVQEQTVFDNLSLDVETLWSFFLFSGYLKVTEKIWKENEFYYRLAVPNTEVALLFQHIVKGWLRREIGPVKVTRLMTALIDGDMETFGAILSELVRSMMSYYDTADQNPERVYHAFVLGLLVHLRDRYEITSNRESGYGRYDLTMRPRNPAERGIVFEFKSAKSADQMEVALQEGLDQIESRHYGAVLEEAGVQLRSEIAVVFHGKEVRIRAREIDTRKAPA